MGPAPTKHAAPGAAPQDVTVKRFPTWGDSPYFTVELRGRLRLRDLLTHLTVLIPVLDGAKHYYVGPDEIDKLLRRGADWLVGHPERELIAARYLRYRHNRQIDDTSGTTVAAASSLETGLKGSDGTKVDDAKRVGQLVAERAKAAGIDKVVFDRAGFKYHGRVRSLAEAAREAGLDF